MQQFDKPFAHLDAHTREQWMRKILADIDASAELWVFGYGSLLWRPCYEIAEALDGRALNCARRLCIWTIEARGTPECPGLGLGLEPDDGNDCSGVVHRIADKDRQLALDALWEREMLTGIYLPTWVSVKTKLRTVKALAFVVQTDHPQYAGRLSIGQQANHVANASGVLGTCADYVQKTLDALQNVGLSEPEIVAVMARVRELAHS